MAWIDPPKNTEAGGVITVTEHSNETEVFDSNTIYHVGFRCERQWYWPFLSDHYESWGYQSFVKFKVPTTFSGDMESAELYTRLAGIVITDVPEADTFYQHYYYKSISEYNPAFPWDPLSEDDWDGYGWSWVGVDVDDFQAMYDAYTVSYDAFWLNPVDVTVALQDAIDRGDEWIAIRVAPTSLTPDGYDWDNRLTDEDQECVLSIWGALNAPLVPSPSGFSLSECAATPWLKITYSGGDTQYEPGEDVNAAGEGNAVMCVAVDYKTQIALAGTISGGLWFTWSGGGEWEKIYELDEGISAVWCDIIKNFQDYPDDELSFFGTVNGNLYRSVDSFGGYYWVKKFPSAIVDIMTSNTDSDKVIVGVEDGIWISRDGGVTWLETLEAPA